MLIINTIEYNNKFISADTSYNSIFAYNFLKLSSNPCKHLITIHVTIYIINLLKMVNIKNGYRNSVILLFLETFYSICGNSFLVIHMCKRIKLQFFYHISNLIIIAMAVCLRDNTTYHNPASIAFIHYSSFKS